MQISQKLSEMDLKFPGKSQENNKGVESMCDQLKNVKINLFQSRDTSDTRRDESKKEEVSGEFIFHFKNNPFFLFSKRRKKEELI